MIREAVVLVSHGTVENLDDLGDFVSNVRRGRPAPPELVAELRRRYEGIGGSPLNRVNAEVGRKLAARLGVPVVSANRLWHPYVRDVIMALEADGVRRVVLVPLAQHSVHIYADDGRRAAEGTGVDVACVPAWGDRSDLAEAFTRRIVHALGTAERTMLVMTAHSLPVSVIAAGDPYERDVRAAAAAIASRVRQRADTDVPVVVAFQSQGLAGATPIEWLGPDLRTALDRARAQGADRVLFAPIGFLADHVEVLYDLDIEARALAVERGLSYVRTSSLNADADFVDILVEVTRPFLSRG